MLLILTIFALRFKPVQTFVAKKAANYLSKELKTTVSLTGLYIKPFKSIVLENFLVLDLQKDTLAYFQKFTVDINKFSLSDRILNIRDIQVDKGTFFLKDYKDGGSNLDFIIDYFESPAPKGKKGKKFDIIFNKIILNNTNFKYKNLKYNEIKRNQINFEDIDVKNLNGIFEDLNTDNHIIQAKIKNLNLREKSGFYLKNLTTFATVDSNAIELQDLLLITNKSRLKNYYQMKFKSYRDFREYTSKVRMKANFEDSHIASSDIAYFAPELAKMNLDIDASGQVTGYVNDLKAKKFAVNAGKATYIKGDFSLKGLPDWEQTFMDLKIEMAGTNKKDLDDILTDITGKKVKMVPDIINKFGNINFNGYFTGFQNDFIAYGEFKTKLGRLKSDVNMKIDQKGTPSYNGNVKTYDFNLGNLIDEKLLGRITSELYVKGKGIEVKELTEDLNGKVTYLDFNNYRYRNININGTFDKKFFNGNLKINDKNVQLVFNGGVNLNPALPIFNFTADIKNAKLRTLNLFKDSLKIDATLKSNFSGNNLDNIQGDLTVEKVKLDDVRGIYNIDSVQLKATGIGIDRSLTVKSDILEAGIKGQYDLNTIVSYFKSTAKKYIPSLTANIIEYKTQIFDFSLRIKNFEPIAELISPGLEIDNQSLLIGSFDSRNNKATLGGIIKRLKFKGITANNIIIDENTSERQLTTIITSDRIDINDSLNIKNINISNILRNDSLAFNIKLSNAEDANQLDLNGLVEFANENAKISILPSNLLINHEEWNIEDKVQISFSNGKTSISNFSLANKDQEITANGVISDNVADLFSLEFKDFKLNNLNPFVKTLGLKLNGNVNGKTKLYSILKQPRINDSLTIDSLGFNNTYIGTLTDTSSFNSENKMIKVFTKVRTSDRETVNAEGFVDLMHKTIDVNAHLNDSELAILEPFVSRLVSKLKGKISADLAVNGSLEKPNINGSVKLDEAQLMVNYLKTTYVISDEIEIEKGILSINNLKLKDLEDHSAIANGKVDLNNLDNPYIDVNLVANSLMALNTTSRDNSLYYGRAYGTGEFTFKGPTNNMYIKIDAKTEKGTVFNLPLNSSEMVSEKDFITFVSKDTTKVIKKQSSFEGLTMSFKLKVDPNTVANIYTVLGKLTGKGNAELELNINNVGDFEMKGDYVIESGNFDFTAQEVINKRFDIRQGGTIRWTGNPTAAQINLKAVYALSANLSDLYRAANRDGSSNENQSVKTEVEMGLSGLLLQPDIKLDISFPANPAIKDELQAYFNDGNNLNTQALSLIIQRRFAPGTGKENLTQQLGSVGTSTATELLFSQFNSLLSSLNLNFVDINIRSLNEASASFKFFNDRIIVNAGVIDNSKSSIDNSIGFSNSVGHELEILALIKKDGNLVARVANKPPTQQSIFFNPGIDPNRNITSLGLIYSQQFDTFSEFLSKISGKYRREQKKREAQKASQSINKDAIIEKTKKNQKK